MMKSTVIFIGLFFVFAAVAEDEKECPIMAALKRSIDDCIKELNPSEETLTLVAEEKGDDLEEVQCFQACMMNKAGLMENGHAKFDTIEKLLRSAENPNEEEINKIMEMMKSCKDEAEVSDNECVVAGNYAKCAKEKKGARK